MKKHNLFKVVMITIIVCMLLSWVLPVSYMNGSELVENPVNKIGLFELANFSRDLFSAFGHISLYVLAIGGLYGVLHKIGGYRNLLDKIVKGFKNYEYVFMAIVIVVFALLSGMVGLSLPLMVLFPFVISIILLMGYDKITAALVTAGSTAIGLIGSVFSVNNTYGIDMVLQGATAPDKNQVEKILLLVIGVALLIFNVVLYSKKHKSNKEIEASDYVPEVTNKKSKSWPIVVVLDVMLVILALAFFSWDLFGVEVFADWLKKVNEFEVFGIAIFDAIFGLSMPFGYWTLLEAAVLIFLISWYISFLYRVKFNEFLTNFMNGAKRALKPAVLVMLIYFVLAITYTNPTLLTLTRPILELTEGFNVITMAIVAIIVCVLSVELFYGASTILPFVTGSLFTTLAAKEVMVLGLVWQSMNGVAMLFAPTSIVLIATLAYLHVPYQKWLKAIWKLLLELFVILLIVLTILTLI